MLTKKRLRLTNIVLAIVCFFLFLNFLGVELPTYGLALEKLDRSEPACFFQLNEQHHALIDLNQCCFELQKQLTCQDYNQQINNVQVHKKCFISQNTPQYFVNLKTYRYCQNEGFQIN